MRGAETSVHDLEGGWLTPGLIDCHTHLIFGGDRADEFERRLSGETYESIAAQGGGIRASVRHTRAASDEVLLASALGRTQRLLRDGVTTLEIKSGYGLDRETELRMLRLGRRIGQVAPLTVRTTYLAAHALPEGVGRQEYLDDVVHSTLPAVIAEGAADQIDAFLEPIAFSASECERVLNAGMEAGLGGRLHADQLTDSGGAAFAARLGLVSADHLEFANEDGIAAMAAAGTVAVLLPGAFYTLRQDHPPPVASLRALGVPMAVATDLNPGTSPLPSLLLAMNQGCTLFGLTPKEAFAGVTIHAASALGLADRGRIAPGLRADFAIWDFGHPRELAYWIGAAGCRARVVGGTPA